LTRIFAARSGAMALLMAGLILMAGLTVGENAHAAGNGTVQISPSSQTVPGTFTVTIQTNTNVVISGAQSDLTFDQARLQVFSVVRGTAWNSASFVIGVAPQTQQQAIAESNTTGRLKNIGLFYEPGVGSVPVGTHNLVTVTMRAIQCGNNTLGVSFGEILDANGEPATVSHTGGSANQTIDTDGDTTCDGADSDDDNDTWTDTEELVITTTPLDNCGVNAWPADINNNNASDTADISALTGNFGKAVLPAGPAPARHDIAPTGFIDTADIARMTARFGDTCVP
jgi:hypothetical protein